MSFFTTLQKLPKIHASRQSLIVNSYIWTKVVFTKMATLDAWKCQAFVLIPVLTKVSEYVCVNCYFCISVVQYICLYWRLQPKTILHLYAINNTNSSNNSGNNNISTNNRRRFTQAFNAIHWAEKVFANLFYRFCGETITTQFCQRSCCYFPHSISF